ncbi:MAG TPA: DNA methyltransferase [Candidatus Saccharimonadales bacterium]|nr:DNA methyltransferase [Candidatus Saccharimonadales bacterium]
MEASTGNQQLDLHLVDPLPRLAIAPEWKDQQRLWGHSFHPMCSYLASFPAALAHAFIARYSRPGDVVLDPFSGRGTTPLQSCAEGRIGAGNDLNPLAHLLTAAKVDPPTRAEVQTRVTRLRLGWAAESAAWETIARGAQSDPASANVPAAGSLNANPSETITTGTESIPAEVSLAFHPHTLAQLLFVRASLELHDRTDRFIAAALVGILHGKSRSYLSEIMPNTFSMAPRYVRDFAARTSFQSPQRDVFACLDQKLRRLDRQPRPAVRGLALLGDARDAGRRFRDGLAARSLPTQARLVVTSPPYLRVVKYGYYNWLRTWFLGEDAREIDATLDDAHHRAPYLTFLRESLAGLRVALTDDAVVVLVIGDVEQDRGRRITNGIGLAEATWEAAAQPEGYRLAGIALDDVAANRKMTKLWGEEAGQATKVDRILVLGVTEAGRRRAVNGAGLPVDWTWPRRLRAI